MSRMLCITHIKFKRIHSPFFNESTKAMNIQNGKIILARFIWDFVLDHKTGRSRQYGPVIVQSLLRFPFFFQHIWAISQVCTYHYCFSMLHRSTYIHMEFGQQDICAVENDGKFYVYMKLGMLNVFTLNLIVYWFCCGRLLYYRLSKSLQSSN